MPLVRPTAPDDARAAFSALAAFLSAPPSSTEHYVGTEPAIPTLADLGTAPAALLHDAQQVFVLGLTDAASNAGAGAAAPAGWRFFAGTAQGKTVMGRVSNRPPAGWKMTAALYGDRVWAALQASRALDSLAHVAAGKYELRVLAVPGLNLEAFWMVDRSAAAIDLVVPFPAMPDQPIRALNSQPVYTMPDFLAAIRPLAELRLTAAQRYGS